MMRLTAILFLVPSVAFADYTEFYCQSGGSNVNAGSTTSNSPTQKVHGNWTNLTGVYTVQDGTNPTAYCSVGDWVAVMVDGGTVAAWVARVSAVQNATNGTITANTTGVGAKPANQTGTATITIGGAWQGPNGASGFPFTLAFYGNNIDSSSHMQRTNLKNDQTYSVTASFTPALGGNPYVVQGYTSSVNDGGKAVIDGGTSTGTVLGGSGPGSTMWADLKFTTSITTGNAAVVITSNAIHAFIRCVFTGANGSGPGLTVTSGSGGCTTECEFYDNGGSGATMNNYCRAVRCYFHDNGGGATAGNNNFYSECIFDSNSGAGLGFSSTTSDSTTYIKNCDFYNNGSDAIVISSAANTYFYWIENCNFIKNTGAAINNGTSVKNAGYVYNCGYGAGTQANGSADTLGNLVQSGTITYANDVTPWVAPTTGNFSINLTTAQGVGRGAFQENDGTNTGTVGYPDIGAAQAQIGTAFPTPTPTPTATATATFTPTPSATVNCAVDCPTPTATPTATFTPTATATATFTPTATPTNTPTPTPTAPVEVSYGFPG